MLSLPSIQENHGIPRGSRSELQRRVVWTQRVVQNQNTTKERSVLKSWNGSRNNKQKKTKKKGEQQQQKKKNQVKTLKQNVTYTLLYIRHATWISFGFTPDWNVASGNWCLCLIRTFVILLTISCLDSHTARQLKKLFDGGMTLVYCVKFNLNDEFKFCRPSQNSSQGETTYQILLS
jgi:hypothetical protein